MTAQLKRLLRRLLKREGLVVTLYLTGLSILGVIAYQIGG